MYASYVSGDLFSFTFFMALQRQFTNVECYYKARRRWEMKKRSHLHHNRTFSAVIIYDEISLTAVVAAEQCDAKALSLDLFFPRDVKQIFHLPNFFSSVVYILCIPGRDFTSQCIIWTKCVCFFLPLLRSRNVGFCWWAQFLLPQFFTEKLFSQQIKQFRMWIHSSTRSFTKLVFNLCEDISFRQFHLILLFKEWNLKQF